MSAEHVPFVPETFHVQELVTGDGFVIRKLSYADVEMDYDAVMSSIAIIHKLRGGTWPEDSLTKEEDAIDLGWHQREFEFRSSFAYTVTTPNGKTCLGCVYIYPTDKPWIHAPEDSDAVVNMWVTQAAFDTGFYPKLFSFVQYWIANEWPFTRVFYSNKQKPSKS